MKPILDIFASVNALAKQAVVLYETQVNAIIIAKNTNEKEIQRTLDGMLDFCFHNDMLLLFKKLCRYYYDINPHATADYIRYYKELWDTDDNETDS